MGEPSEHYTPQLRACALKTCPNYGKKKTVLSILDSLRNTNDAGVQLCGKGQLFCGSTCADAHLLAGTQDCKCSTKKSLSIPFLEACVRLRTTSADVVHAALAAGAGGAVAAAAVPLPPGPSAPAPVLPRPVAPQVQAPVQPAAAPKRRRCGSSPPPPATRRGAHQAGSAAAPLPAPGAPAHQAGPASAGAAAPAAARTTSWTPRKRSLVWSVQALAVMVAAAMGHVAPNAAAAAAAGVTLLRDAAREEFDASQASQPQHTCCRCNTDISIAGLKLGERNQWWCVACGARAREADPELKRHKVPPHLVYLRKVEPEGWLNIFAKLVRLNAGPPTSIMTTDPVSGGGASAGA
jgi:hypothetical protein